MLLDVQNLVKVYDDKQVLDHLSFQVRDGEILGILGPNGAGKSTTFKIINGLAKQDSGEVYFNGDSRLTSARRYKTMVGVVLQEISLYGSLTVHQNLRFFGKMYSIGSDGLERRIDTILNEIGLYEKKHGRVDSLSGGMKRRINIAMALVHDPQLIIMDEPTVGVDPRSRSAIWGIITQLKGQGNSVIITSHYVNEIEHLSDRVLIMDWGRVIAEGTVNDLIHRFSTTQRYVIGFYGLSRDISDGLKAIQGVQDVALDADTATIVIGKDADVLERIIRLVMQNGLDVRDQL
jgi:ABC-2 type transport system ATP-binding protein